MENQTKGSLAEKFIVLDPAKITEAKKKDVISKLDRAITRRILDLEDKVSETKSALESYSTITSLDKFDADQWIARRNELINEVALAEAELSNFKENFQG